MRRNFIVRSLLTKVRNSEQLRPRIRATTTATTTKIIIRSKTFLSLCQQAVKEFAKNELKAKESSSKNRRKKYDQKQRQKHLTRQETDTMQWQKTKYQCFFILPQSFSLHSNRNETLQ